jgi:hypothetical protein
VDVSAAKEERVDAAQVPQFHAQYETIAASATRPTWLLQHRPIWSAPGYFGGQLVGANKTLAAAASGLIPAQVTLMLSGHHHIFQVLEYDGGLPPQVVSGHGGDYLNAGPSADPAGWAINGVTVKSGLNMLGVFGFSVFEKQEGEAWRLTTYDRLGVALKTCLLADRTASCAK